MDAALSQTTTHAKLRESVHIFPRGDTTMPPALKGWKTYALSAVGVLLAGLHGTGYIDKPTFESLSAAVAFLAAMAMRAGIQSAK